MRACLFLLIISYLQFVQETVYQNLPRAKLGGVPGKHPTPPTQLAYHLIPGVLKVINQPWPSFLYSATLIIRHSERSKIFKGENPCIAHAHEASEFH